jgi:heat shock protein HslJ
LTRPLAFSVVAGLALSACCTAPPSPVAPTSTTPIHLSGTRWIMEDEASSPHYPTIAFENARASGYDGCNEWFAPVTQNGESLHFQMVGTTRRACPVGAGADAERRFLVILSATRYGHYDQDTLVLLDADQRQLARFNADR